MKGTVYKVRVVHNPLSQTYSLLYKTWIFSHWYLSDEKGYRLPDDTENRYRPTQDVALLWASERAEQLLANTIVLDKKRGKTSDT